MHAMKVGHENALTEDLLSTIHAIQALLREVDPKWGSRGEFGVTLHEQILGAISDLAKAPEASGSKLTDEQIVEMARDHGHVFDDGASIWTYESLIAFSRELLCASISNQPEANAMNENPTSIDFSNYQPIEVQDQLEEHQGTAFEIYEFSNGTDRVGRIMTRQEFDKECGHTLRIQLERARENRRLNRIEDSYRVSDSSIARTEALTDEQIESIYSNQTAVTFNFDKTVLRFARAIIAATEANT